MARHLIEDVSKSEVRSKYDSVEEWFDKDFNTGTIPKKLLYVKHNEMRNSYEVHFILGEGHIIPDR